MIWEVMRYDVTVQTGAAPKLNNDFRAFYARLIMAQETGLEDVFEIRRSAADDATGHVGQSRDASRDVTRAMTRD